MLALSKVRLYLSRQTRDSHFMMAKVILENDCKYLVLNHRRKTLGNLQIEVDFQTKVKCLKYNQTSPFLMSVLCTGCNLRKIDKANASINYFKFELCQFKNILLFHYNFNKLITLALNLSSN